MTNTQNLISYCVNESVTPEQYIDLLSKTTLGARRPLHNIECINAMLKHANLIVTAWMDNELVGLSRSLTDYHYCCYLSDLAVSEKVQKMGIGTKLIEVTTEQLKPGCKIILLSAPQAVDYYPKLGFDLHPSAWVKQV
ncbi:GCN5 family acetyltransferase (plasmid) [Acinetobacter sp. NCu2D-2]|uniref:GNAT family N-acetyltransferase n=1 Tax=Acinetobacter sp. NCu2D-2 TaxID=1608473 RepID=UPI0007CDB95D|nr:GNAT family N-acetyltransferase [Acinetobacter sp. NCu2D-2]ANF83264.1 GCN5 family acetyltransferase [Acinetobacter sp. NCu2D-2]